MNRMLVKSCRTFFGLCLLSALAAVPFSVAENSSEPKGKRTADGYRISEGAYLDVPEDRAIRRVASNVIAPESSVTYLKRKIEQVETRIQSLEKNQTAQFEAIQARLAEIQKSLEEKPAKVPS